MPRQRVLTVNEEDGNTRGSEEPGEQVEVGGGLGEVKVCENNVNTERGEHPILTHAPNTYLAPRMETP